MAITSDQKILRFGTATGRQDGYAPQKSNTNIYAGTVAVIRSGYLVDPMAGVTSTDMVVGIIDGVQDSAPHTVSPMAGGAVDGTHILNFNTGSFWLTPGTAGDALTQANVESVVYLIDGVTVGATNGGATRPGAGILEAIGVGPYAGLVAVRVGTNSPAGDI